MQKRECGDCQLCCELVPVEEIRKKAGHKCEHQKEGIGCAIYANRPISCYMWSCGYLAMPEAQGLASPHISHYIIHPDPDYVNMVKDGKETKYTVMVVWVDPKFPDAYKDPKLLYLLNKHKLLVKLNFNSVKAKLLIPPSLSEGNSWIERDIQVDWNTPRAREAIRLGLV